MEKLDELQQESVDHILRAGHHLLSLINEVLDISRVEANRLELSIEPVAVDEVLEAAIALVQGHAQEKQITIRFDDANHCSRFVMADRQRLLQVLINLLSNGMKYNHHGGQLTLSCAPLETDQVRIAVTDTGPGIAPDDLKKLFMPFERLNAPQNGIEGTGLGLALSRRLIEAMNGTLTVESTLGQGSTFIIHLPVAPDLLKKRNLPPLNPCQFLPLPKITTSCFRLKIMFPIIACWKLFFKSAPACSCLARCKAASDWNWPNSITPI